ncbi:sugar phosphate nucleotidyltransferase [Streptosporangium sp. NPDC006007]|uniref:sugar phosphate nucleotidyltransferase n=1 Tax=Streptosporangium sp. NPDC006007 TaxID=3154575 RepID=UPI0033A07813
MKAIVLARDAGPRLLPIGLDRPRCLAPVAGRPLILHGLDAIRVADITQVIVVVGGAHAGRIKDMLGRGSRFGLEIEYVRQDEALGLAHAVHIAKEALGVDDFLVYLADNMLIGGVRELVSDYFSGRPEAMVALNRVEDPGRCGVAQVGPDGLVRELAEKPAQPKGNLAVAGLYALSPAIYQALVSIRPGWQRRSELTDALTWLIEHGYAVKAHSFTGYWRDVSRVDHLLEANRAALLALSPATGHGAIDDASEVIGSVVIEAGAKLARSLVIGPSWIGEGAVIVDSVVGYGMPISTQVRVASQL